MSAVGADHPSGRDGPGGSPRFDDRGVDATGIHAQTVEFGPVLHGAAEFYDPLAEDDLGHLLRDVQHESILRPVAAEFEADQRPAVGVHVEPAHHLTVVEEPFREAHHVEHLERAGVHAQGAGLQDHPVALVDDPGLDAAGQQPAGQHEPGRPRTDHEDLAIVRVVHGQQTGPSHAAGTSEELPRAYVSLASIPDS